MTLLAEKLKEAGIDTDAVALDAAMREAMEAAKGNVERATERLATAIRSRPDLLRTMIRRTLTEFQNSAKADGGQFLVAHSGQASGAADLSRGEGQNRRVEGQKAAAPLRDPETASGEGHPKDADQAVAALPPARDTLTEAARVLRRAPGSGALQRRAYETRDRLRGESWLLSFTIPDGPRLLALTWGEAEAMGRRMAKEGGERMVAAAALAALLKEGALLGQTSPDQIIEKTLPPAAIDRVARLLEPEKLSALGRKTTREFAQSHVEMIGAANG